MKNLLLCIYLCIAIIYKFAKKDYSIYKDYILWIQQVVKVLAGEINKIITIIFFFLIYVKLCILNHEIKNYMYTFFNLKQTISNGVFLSNYVTKTNLDVSNYFKILKNH